jgi:DNA-directed RNA polymerase II subunit RPB9
MDCGENEAVYFQSQQRTAATGMVSRFSISFHVSVSHNEQALYYVCCGCGSVSHTGDSK